MAALSRRNITDVLGAITNYSFASSYHSCCLLLMERFVPPMCIVYIYSKTGAAEKLASGAGDNRLPGHSRAQQLLLLAFSGSLL